MPSNKARVTLSAQTMQFLLRKAPVRAPLKPPIPPVKLSVFIRKKINPRSGVVKNVNTALVDPDRGSK